MYFCTFAGNIFFLQGEDGVEELGGQNHHHSSSQGGGRYSSQGAGRDTVDRTRSRNDT